MPNAVLETIAARRSHRAYAATPVTQEQIDILLNACLQSPSAVNRQPWHVTVVRNQRLLDEINAEVVKDMQTRADKKASENYHVFFHAPLVFFLSADPEWRYSQLDCGIAVENMNLAAESLGLGCVILGRPRAAFEGEKREAFERALDFRPGERFMIALAVGVPADDKPAHSIAPDHVSYVD